ncbi:aldose 1-epimerase family protein [Loigolactobacillus coryniformis]|uniref:Aldose 1-epimerase n=1 Tax=Loigolactobacillus coryniformis subsp. coryniformis CECT 5711 TaxID=1185325 RepID=J3EPM2_9LACO|nr:aldose 1-epimerase family protein [Loigolactobacillus coryniformis]EJN55095.1 Aldose 1-epimerase [Loigolactobacillus coryniformis subsp. coryniformis CECT 5711]
MLKLENDNFVVTISTLGAELQSVYNKVHSFEYLWDDKERGFWGRHAPILFPFIGRSNQDSYLLHEQTYQMTQHGFIRDQEFTLVENDHTHAVLRSVASAETMVCYPFDFEFTIHYELTTQGLNTTFVVTNRSTEKMPFALGSHPGFNLENDLSDYELQVTAPEGNDLQLQQFGIQPAPYRDGSVQRLAVAVGNRIPLSHQLLDDGLIIIANNNLQSIKLHSNKSLRNVTLSLTDFPYVALWSPEKKNAPFICIEPFAGLPDKYGQPVNLLKKLGNNILAPHESQQFEYRLTLM